MSRLINAMTAVFGTPAAVAAPPAGPANPMTPTTVVPNKDAGTQNAEVDPTAGTAKPPLEAFAKFWDTPAIDPKAPAPPKSFLENISPEKVALAAKGVDFSAVVTPATLELVAKGGADGVKAMLVAMNSMAQEVYAKSALATSAIVKAAGDEKDAKYARELPTKLKEHAVIGASAGKNPALANPALAPMVRMMEQQALIQNPGASPAEITEMVDSYFKGINDVMNPKNQTQSGPATNRGEDVDWMSFADS